MNDGVHKSSQDPPSSVEIPTFDPPAHLVAVVDSSDAVIGDSAAQDISERNESDQSRFQLAAIVDSADDAIVSKDLNGVVRTWNQGAVRTFGYTSEEMVGQPIRRLIPEELHYEEDDFLRKLRAGERVDHYESFRLKKNGERIEVSVTISPIRDASGRVIGASKIARDISERKRMERALVSMSRKLIEAHEQERSRIARDLHDDFVQRLALLAMELERIQRHVPDPVSELGRRIGDLRNQTIEIANDVQLLSHELHSSKLEYLGIVSAAKSFSKEFSERQNVEIDFQSHDLPAALPTELSLSLFRVLQEGLRNATKHSGVKRFEVRLWGSTREINLTISDLGAGFDQETAMKSMGLGLTSMRERLRLVDGELSINSQPKCGTTIHACVPFKSSSDSASVAGWAQPSITN